MRAYRPPVSLAPVSDAEVERAKLRLHRLFYDAFNGLLTKRRLSRKQVARAAGMSPTTLTKVVRTRAPWQSPTLNRIAQLEAVLGCPPGTLLAGPPSPTAPVDPEKLDRLVRRLQQMIDRLHPRRTRSRKRGRRSTRGARVTTSRRPTRRSRS